MSEAGWIPLPPDAPFPERMQGEWVSETTGQTMLRIDGRGVVYGDRPLPVGELAVLEEKGTVAVRNEGPDEPQRNFYWGGETLHVFWFNPGDETLNFHGIGDHGWAVRAPAQEAVGVA